MKLWACVGTFESWGEVSSPYLVTLMAPNEKLAADIARSRLEGEHGHHWDIDPIDISEAALGFAATFPSIHDGLK